MLYKSDIQEIQVSLWITGFECHPDEITQHLGIKPTEIRIKDEKRWVSKKARAPMIHQENAWVLRSELPQTVEPDEHLEQILELINKHKKEFLFLSRRYDIGISFGVHWGYCNPGITLESDLLKQLVDLNIEVEFDMYFLEEK